MCRRDERYLEDDVEAPPTGVKKSRFLRKERKTDLSFKDMAKEVEVPVAPARRRRKEAKPLPDLPEKAVKEEEEQEVERNRHGVTIIHFPNDPDDLDPIARPKPKNVPEVG